MPSIGGNCWSPVGAGVGVVGVCACTLRGGLNMMVEKSTTAATAMVEDSANVRFVFKI